MLKKKNQKGLLFVVSAPTGTGKTTLVQALKNEFPFIKQSISYTTRSPRKGEVCGIDYHFITKEDFQKKVDNEEFLEHIELYDACYGTAKKSVSELQEKGFHVVLVIDTQGGLKIKETIPGVFIFIEPPSIEAIYDRLKKRNTESEESIQKRLLCVEREISQGAFYDYKIINDKLEDAYQILKSIFVAETHRIR